MLQNIRCPLRKLGDAAVVKIGVREKMSRSEKKFRWRCTEEARHMDRLLPFHEQILLKRGERPNIDALGLRDSLD